MAQNILDLIKQDHEKTMSELESLMSSESGRDQKYSSVKKDLIAHMTAEEQVLYPQLESSIRMKVLEAIEEHNTVKMVMEQLDSVSSSDEKWLAKLKVVQENVKHHIKEEEQGDIFREAQEKFSNDQLSEMGTKFQDAKGMMPQMAR